MRKYLVLGFLALGLLMLGCTGQSQSGTGTGGIEVPSGGSGGAGGETGGTLDNESNGLEGLNLEGMTFDQIMALGIPLECDVAQSSGGMDTSMTVKFKGGNVYATGNSTFGGETVENTYLIVAGEVYWSVPEENQIGPFMGCQWLKIMQNSTGVGELESIDPAAPLKTLGSNYNCRPGLFSDSVFIPPRDGVCDMMEKMREFIAGINGTEMPSYQ